MPVRRRRIGIGIFDGPKYHRDRFKAASGVSHGAIWHLFFTPLLTIFDEPPFFLVDYMFMKK